MLRFATWKIVLICLVCLLAFAFNLPNLVDEPTKRLGKLGEYTINPGLDLKGGSYLLLEVDLNAYLNEQLENIKDEIRAQLRGKSINGQRIRYIGGLTTRDQKIIMTLADNLQVEGTRELLRKVSNDLEINSEDNELHISYQEASLKTIREQLLSQSVEIIRRRVDETGTREPDIQRQGDNRILLQVPGLQDPQYLKQLLGKTAKMTFHLLDRSMPYPDQTNLPVPFGSMRLKSEFSEHSYTVLKKVAISGDLLSGAHSGFDQNGQSVVNIRFNNLGAKKFADITKQNIGEPFAIVLDGKILTAPYIRTVILDGNAQISGSFTPQEASDLSLLLRAGALPAPVNIVEERVVGPSLGADSIAAGTNASVLAFGLVVIFMVVSYGFFGLLADIALVMNLILLFATLSFFQVTLTLPGIAGIALTMGMAVDANILIFERIRDEIKNGRSIIAAIENGFKQAFSTIFDANITTLIIAAILFGFGSGSVKGFAITLSLGILTSMFTAISLTRLMISLWVFKCKPKELKL